MARKLTQATLDNRLAMIGLLRRFRLQGIAKTTERLANSMSPLWLDRLDAKSIAQARSEGNSELLRIANDLIDDGFTILERAAPKELCDSVVADFDRYVRENREYADRCRDASGRYLRLVNFHWWSRNAMSLGLQPKLMETLDFVFGQKAGIYTSLYFEYGTQQPIHRDSPFFETFPRNYFVGMWVALEDIDPASGPLMYVPGGHRFRVDPHDICRSIQANNPDLRGSALIEAALQAYYGQVIEMAKKVSEPVLVPLRKGDVAIWHPQAPHGGSPAVDPQLSRRSIVFHCAPEALQVYQHDVFFSHHSTSQPPPRYGFAEVGDRKVAKAGETAFQV
jgi:phytanoyl-CoA hydroxylase